MTQQSKRPPYVDRETYLDVPTKKDILIMLQRDDTPEGESVEWALDRCKNRETLS